MADPNALLRLAGCGGEAKGRENLSRPNKRLFIGSDRKTGTTGNIYLSIHIVITRKFNYIDTPHNN